MRAVNAIAAATQLLCQRLVSKATLAWAASPAAVTASRWVASSSVVPSRMTGERTSDDSASRATAWLPHCIETKQIKPIIAMAGRKQCNAFFQSTFVWIASPSGRPLQQGVELPPVAFTPSLRIETGGPANPAAHYHLLRLT